MRAFDNDYRSWLHVSQGVDHRFQHDAALDRGWAEALGVRENAAVQRVKRRPPTVLPKPCPLCFCLNGHDLRHTHTRMLTPGDNKLLKWRHHRAKVTNQHVLSRED